MPIPTDSALARVISKGVGPSSPSSLSSYNYSRAFSFSKSDLGGQLSLSGLWCENTAEGEDLAAEDSEGDAPRRMRVDAPSP